MPSASPGSKTRGSTGAWLLLALVLIVATIALGSLLKTRYESGETYPIYSSKRSDPLGTRALYEALAQTPGLQVEQNFMPFYKLTGAPGSVLIMCGLEARTFDALRDEQAEELRKFVANGGRLVIALNPDVSISRIDRAITTAEREHHEEREARRKADREQNKASDKAEKEDTKSDKTPPPAQKPKTKSKPSGGTEKDKDEKSLRALAEVFEVTVKSREFFYSGDKSGSPLSLSDAVPMEQDETPRWMSNTFLDTSPAQDWRADQDTLIGVADRKSSNDVKDQPALAIQGSTQSPWRTLASKGGRIMIAERTLDKGSIIICTDRYFLSNEGLSKDPKTKFISWLLGDARRIIFEETHLAAFMGDSEGVMTLARRHHMEGLFLGGILLFALYIWRNSISLVPPRPDDDLAYWRGDAVAGKGSASALEGLLRRGIALKPLLKRCFETWLTTRGASQPVPADRIAKARAILDSSADAWRQAPATYQAMRDALHPPRR